jgi:hypothetical protein
MRCHGGSKTYEVLVLIVLAIIVVNVFEHMVLIFYIKNFYEFARIYSYNTVLSGGIRYDFSRSLTAAFCKRFQGQNSQVQGL